MKRILAFAITTISIFCQAQEHIPDWQHKDLQTDSIFGISTTKAYSELLKGKKSKQVLVAVLDSGIDTLHEDLASIIWTNPREKNNNKDDDRNGYIDDRHGWDFIGGKTGEVSYDNLELVRIIRRDKPFFDSLEKAGIPASYKQACDEYDKMKADYDKQSTDAKRTAEGIGRFKTILENIISKLNPDSLTLEGFKNYLPTTDGERHVCKVVIGNLESGISLADFKKQDVDAGYDHFKEQADYQLNINFDPRPIVGDDYSNSNERNYGNNNVYGPHADHGTHVAGIIGAIRDNNTGINGIAGNVRIMSVRTVPDGDERDKDVANAIRYAAENGARVINMSFGKPYSWDKKAVDAAVRYAMKKDVLLVHASGNEGLDLDSEANKNFPNKYFEDGGIADNWITVGASGMKDDSTLVASFSNYGKVTVDVFAPGVQIYSSTPGSTYQYFDGTSMAAPVVTGLAALIREYYPKLKARQVKEIIMQSVEKPAHDIIVKEGNETKRLPLSEICVSGGIVNAYKALLLAATYK